MNGWHRRITRLVGAGTAAYGASLLVAPKSLAKQCGLANPDDPAARLLAVTFGVRDLASGVSILLAGDRAALRTALLLRAVMDGADAAACALFLDDPRARTRVAGVAGVWSALALALAASA